MNQKSQEIITYIVFGVLTTLVNWCIYVCCVGFARIDMTLSNLLAWCGAILFAFVTNKLIVFKSHDLTVKNILKEALFFFFARTLSGVVEIILPTILFTIGLTYSFLGITGFWAKAIVSIVVIILNYVFSKKIVFNTKEKG